MYCSSIFKVRWGCYNQIKKGLLLGVRVKKIKINEYLAKLQTRAWLSHALVRLAKTLLKDDEIARDITFFLVTLPNIYRFKKKFSLADSAVNIS